MSYVSKLSLLPFLDRRVSIPQGYTHSNIEPDAERHTRQPTTSGRPHSLTHTHSLAASRSSQSPLPLRPRLSHRHTLSLSSLEPHHHHHYHCSCLSRSPWAAFGPRCHVPLIARPASRRKTGDAFLLSRLTMEPFRPPCFFPTSPVEVYRLSCNARTSKSGDGYRER